ncbi:MAG: hypothetical protein ABFR90_08770 [Planctomycetota bacterium]
MDTEHEIPISLKIVAWLFIIGGIFAVLEVIVSLMHSHININFGVLGLFIGPGLLHLRSGWRTCALVFIWLALILVPIAAVFMLTTTGPLDFMIFGQKAGHVGKGVGFSVAVFIFALTFWQYRVLTRLDVRRLFGVDTVDNDQRYQSFDEIKTTD